MRRAILVLSALAAAAVAILLLRPQGHDLLIADVFAAALEGRPGEAAVFLTVANSGAPDRLAAVESGAAASARIASSQGGGLPMPGGGTVSLAADGAHLRLAGVQGGLEEGRILPLVLHFERAGEVSARARVGAAVAVGEAEALGLVGIGDICRVGEGEPAPRISLSAEALEGGGWRIEVAARDFAFRKDLVDGLHVPGTGHGHLYVGGAKVGRLYAPEAEIGPLPPGRHLVRVTLNTNDHRAYVVGDAPASAELVLEAP